MNQIGKEADKQATRCKKLLNEMRRTKKDVHGVQNDIYYAKLALDYFTEYEKPLLIEKLMEMQNKAHNLLVKVDAA